jgi:hypothetical protein
MKKLDFQLREEHGLVNRIGEPKDQDVARGEGEER